MSFEIPSGPNLSITNPSTPLQKYDPIFLQGFIIEYS